MHSEVRKRLKNNSKLSRPVYSLSNSHGRLTPPLDTLYYSSLQQPTEVVLSVCLFTNDTDKVNKRYSLLKTVVPVEGSIPHTLRLSTSMQS